MVLNSPWFDMQGSAWLRSPAARVAIERLGASRPMREIPRKISEVYGRSLHVEHSSEANYDLAWKPLKSRPVYVGWLRAVRRGHTQLARRAGRALPDPGAVVGALLLRRADRRDRHDPRHRAGRRATRRWASSVGRHVTSVAIDGAMHDIVLSRPPVRDRAYAAIDTWLGAWVDSSVGAEDARGARY